MTEQKFTVIIPTRERSDVLAETIRSVLAQDYENLEIIVSDNFSCDDTESVVLSFETNKIKYINTGKRVSMSHNWEFAINHASEGWITILGDDDAIIPGALNRVNKIINETGTLAIRSNGCSFAWPSLLYKKYGKLNLSLKKGYRTVLSEIALKAVLNGDLPYNKLPVLYNGGFIHTSLIKKAKESTKNFFMSMTPDVYSGIVFSLLTQEYIYVNEPLAINGASHHSGGTATFEGIKKNRSYDPAKKFFSEENIPFHKDLPLVEESRPVKSIQAIVYEAYLQAASFHYLKNLKITKDQQLKIILQTSGPHSKEVVSWGRQFAKLHGISFDKIKIKRKNDVLKAVGRFMNLINRFSIEGNEKVPLNNVYEASVVAGLLQSIKPGPLKRLKNICNTLNNYVLNKKSKN